VIRGLDTTFLVEVEIAGHPLHRAARRLLARCADAGDTFGLAPQVLAEFIHVVTDPRRFERPLAVEEALRRAEQWWLAADVVHVFPDERTPSCFLGWLNEHKLGRKRLLDTLLAATYFTGGVRSILTTNARDFRTFRCFDVVEPSRRRR
jgi:predicted nucleic acid-binding protein